MVADVIVMIGDAMATLTLLGWCQMLLGVILLCGVLCACMEAKEKSPDSPDDVDAGDVSSRSSHWSERWNPKDWSNFRNQWTPEQRDLYRRGQCVGQYGESVAAHEQ